MSSVILYLSRSGFKNLSVISKIIFYLKLKEEKKTFLFFKSVKAA
jgi:hypothetical protein